MRLCKFAVGFLALTVTVLLGAGLGSASAEELGPNAWCFRPWIAWTWVPLATEAYIPQIHCQQRELPQGTEAWSSDVAAELAVAPEGWTLPARSQGERTRWNWTHGYEAGSGRTWIFGEMKRGDGESPRGSNASPDVFLSVGCASGEFWLSIVSDVEPLHGEHSVVWWTDRGEYRRAETWRTDQPQPTADVFRATAPFPNQLWAEIRDSTWLHVMIFGDQSWRQAKAHVLRINQLGVLRTLDYCGQDQQAEAEAGG